MKTKLYPFMLMLSVLLVISSSVLGANIYIDNYLSTNCTAENYSIENRFCNGSDGNAYRTIQAAINGSSVGDNIYLRGGTYSESDIDIPTAKNGTAWTAGNFTTLASYPGEWAIINGGGTRTYNCIRHTTGYDKTTGANPTRYWKFERLELTGCRNGLWFTEGPIWVRYCYIHDNHPPSADEPEAGIWINMARENIIEYNYLKDNEPSGGGTANYRNIGFDSDYRDDENPTSFDPAHATRKNIVRYNLVDGSSMGISHKNQQRFGINTRNPATVASTYSDWGDLIHHNVVRNARFGGIVTDQDNVVVYNNILDSNPLIIGWTGQRPITYNATVFNNTVLANGGAGSIWSSGCHASDGCRNTKDTSYCDSGSVRCIDFRRWAYNNIIDRVGSGYGYFPFSFGWESLPANYSDSEYEFRKTNLVVERNLVHSNLSAAAYKTGHRYNSPWNTGCEFQDQSPSSFNSCSNTWRSTTGVTNWANSTASLFRGTTGADKYIAYGTFVVGSTTIANGGIGRSHPYRSGVTIPSYVGATNPSDYSWVAGVLSLASINTLMNGGSEDPGWVEGKGRAAPDSPTGLAVVQ